MSVTTGRYIITRLGIITTGREDITGTIIITGTTGEGITGGINEDIIDGNRFDPQGRTSLRSGF